MKTPILSVFVLIFSVFVITATVASAFFPVSGEETLYDKVVRLHVLANSDSPEDQELKLKVRDSVLETLNGKLKDTAMLEDAVNVLEGELGVIEAAAEERVRSEGYFYDVSVSLAKEHYPEKSYEDITMPSGSYMSLKVEIGEADGQNWWCVVFPPLCLSAATDKESASQENEDALIKVGFTEEQYKIITENDKPRYKLKFKILELFEEWFS